MWYQCSALVVLFTLLAFASRSPRLERWLKMTFLVLSLTTSISLFVLGALERPLWGAPSLAGPLGIMVLVLAAATQFDIPGTVLTSGPNPHEVRRLRRVDEGPESSEE